MTEIIYGQQAMRKDTRQDMGYWWHSLDRVSVILVIVLFAIGLTLSFASTARLAERLSLSPYYFVYKQLIFGVLALIIMIILSQFSPKWVRRFGVLGFLISAICLLLLPYIGESHGKGAIRWLSIASFSIQPVEFFKPGFVIFCAWLLSSSKERGGPPGFTIVMVLTVFFAFILQRQPDYGQLGIVVVTIVAMLYIAGLNMFWLIIIGCCSAVFSVIAYMNDEHVRNRLQTFWNGEDQNSYQVEKAAEAISNSGFFGAGAGDGVVRNSLPDAHTDFVIAVAAEEYGLILVLVIILCFMVISMRSFYALCASPSSFVRIAGTGLTTSFALQSMINLGVASGLLPNKGLTLPFISYGGSSLVAIGITLGFLFALTKKQQSDMPVHYVKTHYQYS